VSTSREDADWIVKLIDVFPSDAPDPEGLAAGKRMGGYQMMVRSEVLRGRFRESYSAPKPFEPNEPTRVTVKLQDVLHTFAKGHRVMVQVQSTWFPLVDRNPQKWAQNIFEAREEDFVAATHRLHAGSRLQFAVLPPGEAR
jgi:predicted acyl esterase